MGVSEGGWTEKQRIGVAEGKVHASIKGTVPGSLREQGGTCSFQSLWAERRRKLRRGSGHSGEPFKGRRKVQDQLGGRDDREIPQDTATNVCCFIFDTELHVAQSSLNLLFSQG